MQQLSFSNLRFNNLEDLVKIEPVVNDSKFTTWFSYSYALTELEENLLANLIQKHRAFLSAYSEEELKMKFIAPILNQVDFQMGKIKDWYERRISAVIAGVELGGKTDFMVAMGTREPKLPYFFIQEFKPSESSSSPEVQLVAELMVALKLNHMTYIRGAYIMGQFWKFIILEKLEDESYRYYTSPAYDSLKLNDLRSIYCYLQAVKADILAQTNQLGSF